MLARIENDNDFSLLNSFSNWRTSNFDSPRFVFIPNRVGNSGLMLSEQVTCHSLRVGAPEVSLSTMNLPDSCSCVIDK